MQELISTFSLLIHIHRHCFAQAVSREFGYDARGIKISKVLPGFSYGDSTDIGRDAIVTLSKGSGDNSTRFLKSLPSNVAQPRLFEQRVRAESDDAIRDFLRSATRIVAIHVKPLKTNESSSRCFPSFHLSLSLILSLSSFVSHRVRPANVD